MTAFPTDLTIAKAASLRPLSEIAARMGIDDRLLLPYGRGVAKIDLAAIGELAHRPEAKYVVVSAVTPTPLGEGKTTTAVGLGQAMARTGRRATVALRQPSMGPAAATARSCRWRRSTCTSRATSTPSPRPTTCSRRWSTTTCSRATPPSSPRTRSCST